MTKDGDHQGGTDRDAELEDRRRQLDAALTRHRDAGRDASSKDARSGSAVGFAQALRLSSEFVAGIVVGAALGWFFDRLFGTSPWGFILLFLLGFCAGVLNVLRSAGLIAQHGATPPDGGPDSGPGGRE